MTLKLFGKIFLILITINFTTSGFADDKMALGLDVYNNKAQCGVCHTLQAAGSEGQIGSDLDQLKPQLEQIVFTVTYGIGVMPAFEGTLTTEEIKAVAFYVFNSTNN